MAAHVVGTLAELTERGRLVVELEGRSIGVIHHRGRLFAVRNACPHQRGPLGEGGIFPLHTAEVGPQGEVREYLDHDRPVVACPWHGWEFDLASGACMADPARRVRTYEVNLVGDDVVVIVGGGRRRSASPALDETG